MILSVFLPAPPSVNTAYLNVPGRGRVKAKVAKRWEHDSFFLIKSEKRGNTPISKPVKVTILININKRRDIDNCAKFLLDSLEKSSVIVNDNQVDHLEIIRSEKNAKVAWSLFDVACHQVAQTVSFSFLNSITKHCQTPKIKQPIHR